MTARRGVGLRAWPIASGLACAALLASGCTPRPCDSALNPNGAFYQVDIAAIYPLDDVYMTNEGWSVSSGLPSCSQADGLGAGAVLQLQTIGQSLTKNSTCQNVHAELLSAPPALTINGVSATAPSVTQVPSVIMYAATDVDVSGCDGVSVLEFFVGTGDSVFAPPSDASVTQPAVMYRLFEPSTGTCAVCQDNFVVQLSAHPGAAASTND